jgi:hypothetical protein
MGVQIGTAVYCRRVQICTQSAVAVALAFSSPFLPNKKNKFTI